MNAYELEIIQATLHSQGELIKQQADRIAELEKELLGYKTAWNEAAKLSIDYIPSTLPQTKPLTDEEIIAIRDSCYVQSGIDEWEFDDVNFARAIEERHGIK